jgi:hypothetical protein
MDILNAKKGRKPLQFKPEALNPEDISDDEYQIMTGSGPDFVEEKKLNIQTNKLVKNFSALNSDTSRPNKEWTKLLYGVGGSVIIDKPDLQDDFKRESCFFSICLDNTKEIIHKIQTYGVNIGRLEEHKDLFNVKSTDTSIKNYKTPKLMKKKKSAKKVDPMIYVDEVEEENQTDYKKHVKVNKFKQYKQDNNSKKKRPGKRARDNKRKNKVY